MPHPFEIPTVLRPVKPLMRTFNGLPVSADVSYTNLLLLPSEILPA